jgi:hypothetical protein
MKMARDEIISGRKASKTDESGRLCRDETGIGRLGHISTGVTHRDGSPEARRGLRKGSAQGKSGMEIELRVCVRKSTLSLTGDV